MILPELSNRFQDNNKEKILCRRIKRIEGLCWLQEISQQRAVLAAHMSDRTLNAVFRKKKKKKYPNHLNLQYSNLILHNNKD